MVRAIEASVLLSFTSCIWLNYSNENDH
jgi:hypothetical protein